MTRLRVADDVAWVARSAVDGVESTTVYVSRLPRGPAVVLQDSAYVVWLAVVDGGSLDDVVDRTAELAGQDAASIRVDVAAAVSDLVNHGLVREE